MFDTPWYQDPTVLFRRPLEFFPTRDMTPAERLNSLARFVAYASIAVAIYRAEGTPLLVGAVVIVVLALVFALAPTSKASIATVIDETSTRATCTPPTPDNPFMNVLADEFGTDKPGACPVTTATMKQSQQYFDQDLPRDISDVYHNRASDRQFVTMPASGTNGVPDTLAFRNFLFSQTANGPKCKSG
jgi:hypothetical protein